LSCDEASLDGDGRHNAVLSRRGGGGILHQPVPLLCQLRPAAWQSTARSSTAHLSLALLQLCGDDPAYYNHILKLVGGLADSCHELM
jgi:hypothetical protein